MTAMPTVSVPCVPVSTTEDVSPTIETSDQFARLKQAVLARRVLINLGWTVGVDKELLAPKWFLKIEAVHE